ncbi:MAG: CHAT domain-containing protein [Bacteroidota bacterium]
MLHFICSQLKTKISSFFAICFFLINFFSLARTNDKYERAIILFQNFNYTGCIDLIESDPSLASDRRVSYLLAKAYFKNYNLDASKKVLLAIIKGEGTILKDTISVGSCLLLSKVYWNQAQRDSAQQFVSKVSTNPHLLKSEEDKILYYAQKGRLLSAIDDSQGHEMFRKGLEMINDLNEHYALDLYQNITSELNRINRVDSALYWISQSLEVQDRRFKEDVNKKIQLNLMKGYILFLNYESAKAIKLYEQVIKPDLFKQHLQNSNRFTFQQGEFCRLASIFYSYNGDLKNSIFYCHQFLKLAPAFLEKGHFRYGEIYRELSESYLKVGKIEAFTYYMDLAIEVFSNSEFYRDGIDFQLARKFYIGEEYDQSVKYASKIVDNIESVDATSYEESISIKYLINSLLRSGQADKASIISEQIINDYLAKDRVKPEFLHYLYYLYLSSAKKGFQRVEVNKIKLLTQIREQVTTYLSNADGKRLSRYTIELISQLNYFSLSSRDKGYFVPADSILKWNTFSRKIRNGLPVSFEDVRSSYGMLASIRNKVIFHRNRFVKERREADLQELFRYVNYYIDLKNNKYLQSIAINDLLLHRNLGYTISNELMAIAEKIPQKYLPALFKVIERERASLLTGKANDELYRASLSIPDSIQVKETSLREQIAMLKSRLETYKNYSSNTFYKDLEENLFQANLELSVYIEFLRETYGYQYDSSVNYGIVELGSLQSNLRDNELICYYYSDSENHAVIMITAKEVRLLKLQSPDKNLINRFRASIDPANGFNQPAKQFEEYVQSSYQLFNEQLKPVLELFPGYRRLRIVPDGLLYQIPFEALVTEMPAEMDGDYGSLNYLINDYLISYTSSITHLYKQQEPLEQNVANGKVLAFAPNYESSKSTNNLFDKSLQNLEWNRNEVAAIKDYYDVDVFTDELASESAFKKEAGEYELLHLAAHAVVRSEKPMNSFLAFSPASQDSINDGLLRASEIFNMSLGADLAILSACNTGSGKIYKGEGMISLSLAFLYAGCPSVLMSYWSADDQATSEIMNYFYAGLADGLQKDEALRNAKLNYLRNASEFKKSPAYWNNFSIVGDVSKISMQRKRTPDYVLPGIAIAFILLILLFLFQKRLKLIGNLKQ